MNQGRGLRDEVRAQDFPLRSVAVAVVVVTMGIPTLGELTVKPNRNALESDSCLR